MKWCGRSIEMTRIWVKTVSRGQERGDVRTGGAAQDGWRKRGYDREAGRKEVPKRVNKDEYHPGMKPY